MYTGQIARKHAARFKEIDETRNSVKDVESAWKTQVHDGRTDKHASIETKETEEKAVPHVQSTALPERADQDVSKKQNRRSRENDRELSVVRVSSDQDYFVDALTSLAENSEDSVNSRGLSGA
jgi:hypothetical protein